MVYPFSSYLFAMVAKNEEFIVISTFRSIHLWSVWLYFWHTQIFFGITWYCLCGTKSLPSDGSFFLFLPLWVLYSGYRKMQVYSFLYFFASLLNSSRATSRRLLYAIITLSGYSDQSSEGSSVLRSKSLWAFDLLSHPVKGFLVVIRLKN